MSERGAGAPNRPRSPARLKSFHHSLGRSLAHSRLGQRASPPSLPPSLPPPITRLRLSTPAVLAVKWVVVCLQERWAIPAAQTFPPVTKGRPLPPLPPLRKREAVRCSSAPARLMVIGNPEHSLARLTPALGCRRRAPDYTQFI